MWLLFFLFFETYIRDRTQHHLCTLPQIVSCFAEPVPSSLNKIIDCLEFLSTTIWRHCITQGSLQVRLQSEGCWWLATGIDTDSPLPPENFGDGRTDTWLYVIQGNQTYNTVTTGFTQSWLQPALQKPQHQRQYGSVGNGLFHLPWPQSLGKGLSSEYQSRVRL